MQQTRHVLWSFRNKNARVSGLRSQFVNINHAAVLCRIETLFIYTNVYIFAKLSLIH